MILEHEIPNGSRLYFGASAKIKRHIENIASEILDSNGYEEIVTPIFSYHQHKSIADEKELIRVNDEKNNSLSLRADSTIDVVRIIEKRLGRNTKEKKWFYIQPVFTYPTTEQYQVGVEYMGENKLSSVLSLAVEIFEKLEVSPLIQISNMKIPKILTKMFDTLNIDENLIEAAITDKTRLVVLNSPSNPTGVAYSLDELKALAEVLLKYPQVLIATDDMYEHIRLNDKPFINILNACPALYDRTIVLNGVSKAYSMTGWRIGYAAGPAWLIGAMKKIQSQSTSNPTSIAQVAAQAALEGSQDCVKEMVVAFKARHEYVVKTLNTIPGVSCIPADGTFYAFPSFQNVIDNDDRFDDDIALAEFLLIEAGVALVPGSAFGAPGNMRLSFATSMDVLEDALGRISKALSA